MQKRKNPSPQKVTATAPGRKSAVILSALLGVCVIYTIWAASAGWGNTLNDHHSFRQTQTAITAYYLVHQPFKLAYETPVLGMPWSIPMELPIYQWIVARISGMFGTPLDQTGRFVSLVASLLTIIPLYFLLGVFRVARSYRVPLLALFLVSPFYIYWSRTFMIESTALLLNLGYLAALFEGTKRNNRLLLGLTVMLGIASGLAKVTTFLPCLLLAFLILIREWLRWPFTMPPKSEIIRKATLGALLLGIPFLAAYCWVQYSDHIKLQNPIAAAYLTSSTISKWNFGTLDQKLDPFVWEIILGRCFMFFGLPVFTWLLLSTAVVVFLVTRRRWKEGIICVVSYLIPPAIFTNLYFIHDYYASANGIFLIGAVGFAIIALFEAPKMAPAGWVLLGLTLICAVSGHRILFYPMQTFPNQEILKAADYVKSHVPKDTIFVCDSGDWAAVLPYYAERKALMLPMEPTMAHDIVGKALLNLKDQKVSALVIIEPEKYPRDVLIAQMRSIGLNPPVLVVSGLPLR